MDSITFLYYLSSVILFMFLTIASYQDIKMYAYQVKLFRLCLFCVAFGIVANMILISSGNFDIIRFGGSIILAFVSGILILPKNTDRENLIFSITIGNKEYGISKKDYSGYVEEGDIYATAYVLLINALFYQNSVIFLYSIFFMLMVFHFIVLPVITSKIGGFTFPYIPALTLMYVLSMILQIIFR